MAPAGGRGVADVGVGNANRQTNRIRTERGGGQDGQRIARWTLIAQPDLVHPEVLGPRDVLDHTVCED
jgi:hypothetical protein